MIEPASAGPAGVRTTPSPGQRRQILQSGIQAPSADNNHRLRFELTREGVKLMSTDTQTWAEQPHRKVLALVSYGAVIENMSLQSNSFGHALAVRWFPNPEQPELVAQCSWSSDASGTTDTLASAIDGRHTNRRFYRRAAVEPKALERMAEAAASVVGAHLTWMDQPGQRTKALQAIRIAETERFRRRALHRELFDAVRFDVGWKDTADQGLPPAALEIELPARLSFAALRHWPLMRALTGAGVHHLLGLRAGYLPCWLAPHIGMVVCRSPDSAIAAVGLGRALQRAWLAAASQGLAFQPFAATLADTHQKTGNGWVSPQARQAILTRLHDLVDDVSPMALFFRVGYANAPSAVTHRPALDRFVSPASTSRP